MYVQSLQFKDAKRSSIIGLFFLAIFIIFSSFSINIHHCREKNSSAREFANEFMHEIRSLQCWFEFAIKMFWLFSDANAVSIFFILLFFNLLPQAHRFSRCSYFADYHCIIQYKTGNCSLRFTRSPGFCPWNNFSNGFYSHNTNLG